MTVWTYTMGSSSQQLAFPDKIKFPEKERLWLIADDLALDFYCCHDGWEASWPMKMTIYADGKKIQSFDASMEMEPSFYTEECEDEA